MEINKSIKNPKTVDKKKIETSIEESTSVENIEEISESSIYQMQTNKNVSLHSC